MELQQIIKRCKQGDKQAFGQLYCDYSESLRAICLHYVPNQTVANDLLHDAFVLIITKIGDLKDTSKADVWMKTVTRNVALLYLREQSRHDDVPLTEVSDASTEPVPPISYQEIMELVEALPAGYRQVFRLSVLDGMNHQQISELLNIEPHSSSSQLFRAKKQLRRWLLPMILVLLVVLVPLSLLLWEDKEIPVSPSQQPSLADKQQENRQPEPSVLSDSVPPTQPIPSIVYKNTQVPHVQLDSVCPAQPELPAQQNRQDCVPPSQPTPSLPVKVQGDAPLLAQTTEGYTGHSSAAASLWSVDLSYSGIDNKRDMQLPYANEETNDVVYDTLSHHHMPLTVTLSLNRRIGSHWQLGTGVRYMRMISDMQSGNTYASLYQHQRVQYLGIPVSVSWYQRLSRQWSVYATANVALNIPLLSTLESHYVLDGTALEYRDEHLHPGLQWSSGLGLGLQYNVSPHVAFFVEPSLQHYFKNNSGVETWNTLHPCTFTVPLGLRVTF